MGPQSRIFGLDLMRAAAVLGVMYLHVVFLGIAKPPGGSELASFGVEIFFVLSGYLVGSSALETLSRSPQSGILEFLTRRWFRTLPAYYAFLLLNLNLSSQHVFDWRYLFFLQTFTGQEPLPYFNESWTLAVEEWFYLLLPFSLLALWGRKLATVLCWFGAFITVSIAARWPLTRTMLVCGG
jgi:peptidoglycan/LPS O-acetylase OafA/YrhL